MPGIDVPRELLLYSLAASPDQVGTLSLLDLAAPSSSSPLVTFKQAHSPAAQLVGYVQTRDGSGGILLEAEDGKAVLNVYSWQKDQALLKIILPQKLSCLAVSPCGDYCAAGTADGRIFMWEIATGTLLSSFDAHYRAINVLRWTHDGGALVSASADSRIVVWSLAGLLSPSQQGSAIASNSVALPYCTFADHTLPVNDLVVGMGSFPADVHVYSASADGSVKIWDIRTRSLLSTFLFPSPIYRIALDPSERFFFASTSPSSSQASSSSSSTSTTSGRIYRVDLFKRRAEAAGHGATLGDLATGWEARGGGGLGDVERVKAEDSRVIQIAGSISALALSLSGTHLLAGTTTGVLHILDVATSQSLRVLPLATGSKAGAALSSTGKGTGAPVTHLSTLLRPADLMGNVELGAVREAPPSVRPVANFARTPKAEAGGVEHVLPVRIGEERDVSSYINPPIYTVPSTGSDIHMMIDQSTDSNAVAANRTRIDELSAEVARLQAQLGRAKEVNDEMWRTVVDARLVARLEEGEAVAEGAAAAAAGDAVMLDG